MRSALIRISLYFVILVLLATVSYIALKPLVTKQYLTYNIIQTEEGFVPKELVIPMGSTVVFSNNTDSPYWPASDLHPSHMLYSAFDPKRALEPTESWSFNFSRQGAWEFHDHLKSHLGGTIFVFSNITNIVGTECEGALEQKSCWNKLLTKTLKGVGLEAAFDLLHIIYTRNEALAPLCHPFAHDIGLNAYRIYKTEVPLIPKTGYCNAGFYHGYMEGLINDKFDPPFADAFCAKVGETLSDTFPNAENQCRHGIGHGAEEYMIRTFPYLWSNPIKLLDKGIAICEESNKTYDERMRCASGVMSVFGDWALSDSKFTPYLSDDIFALCTKQKKPYAKDGCYWEFAKKLNKLNDFDTERSLATFEKVYSQALSEQPYKERTLRSLATHVGNQGVYESDEKLVAICRARSLSLHEACIVGVVEGLLSAGEPTREEARALLFCNFSALSDQEKKHCFNAIQEHSTHAYMAGKLQKTCLLIPKKYRSQEKCA